MRQVETMCLKTGGNGLGLRAQNAVIASWARWQQDQIMSHRLAKAEAAAFGDEVDQMVAELRYTKYEQETEKRYHRSAVVGSVCIFGILKSMYGSATSF